MPDCDTMGKISVRLKPGAKRDKISIDSEDKISISVTSPPVEGKANSHLIKLLSKTLHIPKSSLCIVKGTASREKVIRIEGMEFPEITGVLKEGLTK